MSRTDQPEPGTSSVPSENAEHVWLHAPFLEHADLGDADASERALGAFLVLRVADSLHLMPGATSGVPPKARAAREYIDRLRTPSEEVGHLHAILQGVDAALAGRRDGLPQALMTFADWLQEDFRLGEALDVLDTALAIGRGWRDPITQSAVLLRRARTLRIAGHSHEAAAVYERAGALAAGAGNLHGELLSRIGRGVVLQQLGNLPAAEELLTGVIQDAVAANDVDAHARATHDLAVNCIFQKRPDRAAVLAFRAYQLYTHTEPRLRALSDAGIALQGLGYDSAARDAFELVVARGPSIGIRVRVALELLGLTAKTGDRAAFERWRRSLQAVAAEMPPRVAVDFDLKLGRGYAGFGDLGRARRHLERAIARSEQHSLNELLFRAERDLDTLGREAGGSQPRIDWATQFPDVAEVAETLRAMLIE